MTTVIKQNVYLIYWKHSPDVPADLFYFISYNSKGHRAATRQNKTN